MSSTAGAVAPWSRGYDRAWLSKDIVGGLAAGAVVIPQAMAYATIARLPVEVGLYTCMVPMAVYALLGWSRTLSVSTTSTVAVLTGSTLLSAGVDVKAKDYLQLAGSGVGIALVGFAEGLGAAKTYAARHNYDIDVNRELLGLGAANLGAGLSSGMVVNGSLSKTAVNGSAGAKSQVSGLVVAAMTVLTLRPWPVC